MTQLYRKLIHHQRNQLLVLGPANQPMVLFQTLLSLKKAMHQAHQQMHLKINQGMFLLKNFFDGASCAFIVSTRWGLKNQVGANLIRWWLLASIPNYYQFLSLTLNFSSNTILVLQICILLFTQVYHYATFQTSRGVNLVLEIDLMKTSWVLASLGWGKFS